MDPGIAAIVGVVIGALISPLGQIVVEHCNRRRDSKSVAYAIGAEMRSILENMDRRKYIDHFRQFLNAWERGQALDVLPTISGISLEMEPVAKAHIGQLGLLKPQDASDVVLFYNRFRQLNGEIVSLASGEWSNIKDRKRIVREGLMLAEENRVLGWGLVERLEY